jgi:hypothetical protein
MSLGKEHHYDLYKICVVHMAGVWETLFVK